MRSFLRTIGAYVAALSLLFSNIASAGKDFATDLEDSSKVPTIHFIPIIGSQYSADEWSISTTGNVKSPHGGEVSLSRSFQQYIDQALTKKLYRLL